MTDDDYRAMNFFSHCLRRDEKYMDTWHPDYYPSVMSAWEIYKTLGLDAQFKVTQEEREEWKELVSQITEKLEFWDKLGILPENIQPE